MPKNPVERMIIVRNQSFKVMWEHIFGVRDDEIVVPAGGSTYGWRISGSVLVTYDIFGETFDQRERLWLRRWMQECVATRMLPTASLHFL